jgi:hypothetical protein
MKKAKRRNIGSLWREEVNYLQSYDGQIDAAELLEEVEAQFTADLEEFFGERVSWAYWVNPKEKGRPPKESPAQPAMRGLLSFLHWLQDGLAGISLSPAAATAYDMHSIIT